MADKVRFYCQWDITNRCNLACDHCYIDKVGELNVSEKREVVERLSRLAESWDLDLTVGITGGEPLCDPNLWEIVRLFGERGIEVIVATNGTLIDDEVVCKVKETGVKIAQVSLDGLEDTHDSIRGEGNFQKAVSGLTKLVGAGVDPRVRLVASQRNKDDIADLADFVEGLGVRYFHAVPLIPIGQGKNMMKDVLPAGEFREVLECMAKREGLSVETGHPLWCLVSDVDCSCSAGTGQFSLRSNGDIVPCIVLPLVLGNILKDDLEKVLDESKVLKDLRNRKAIEKCGECAFLEKCGGCRAAAYAVYGDYMAKDPYCWLGEQ